jgi:hypothetical protein
MAGAPIPAGDCSGSGGCSSSFASTGLCLADGTPIGIVLTRDCDTGAVTEDGWLDLTTGVFTAGPPPPGTTSCSADSYDFALSGWLCDVQPDGSVAGVALVQIERDGSGAVIGITLLDVSGAPYTPTGTMTRCPEDRVAAEVLCDAGAFDVPFIRFYIFGPTGPIPFRDTDLDGTPYVVTGPVQRCAEQIANQPIGVKITNWASDSEYVVLCDDAFKPPAPFLRRFDVDEVGNVVFTDTALDGVTPYTPIGSVVNCRWVEFKAPVEVFGPGGGPVSVNVANSTDDEWQVLCDNNGQFLRRLRTVSGVVSVSDFALDGVTPYTPIGTVRQCAPRNTAAATFTLVSGGTSFVTSPAARRVQAVFMPQPAAAAARDTINGVPLVDTSQDLKLEWGDLATSGTVAPLTFASPAGSGRQIWISQEF